MCMSLDIDVCAFEMAISWCRKGKKSLLPFRLSPRHFVCLVFWNCLVIVLSQWKNFHFRYLNLNLDARSIYFSFTCFILLCLLWGRLFIVFGLPDRTQLGLNFGFTKEVTTEFKLDQVNCAKVKYSHYKVYLKNLHPLKKITLEKYSSLKASRPWKIFTHEKYSPLKNNHPWKIFTPEKYSPLKNIHSWKYSPRINIHSWKIVTPEKYSLLENIHPWKIFSPNNA